VASQRCQAGRRDARHRDGRRGVLEWAPESSGYGYAFAATMVVQVVLLTACATVTLFLPWGMASSTYWQAG
jgi:hypothetical protein